LVVRICTVSQTPSQRVAVPTRLLRFAVRTPTRTTQAPAGHGHVLCTCRARAAGGASSNTSRARWQFKKTCWLPPWSGWRRRGYVRKASLILLRVSAREQHLQHLPSATASRVLDVDHSKLVKRYATETPYAQAFQCEALWQRTTLMGGLPWPRQRSSARHCGKEGLEGLVGAAWAAARFTMLRPAVFLDSLVRLPRGRFGF
jgi:hypothetical protein